MKLSILLRTSNFRGDHAADVQIAYEAIPAETVEALVGRIVGAGQFDPKHGDCIEIRCVVATDGEPAK